VKKGTLILLIGLVLGTGGFAAAYYVKTASCRDMMREPQPELAWLKKEFNLSETEFKRVVELHEAYLPQCGERCRKIEEQNQRLEALLAKSSEVTPEVQEMIAERARMRAACETEMLKHFVQVSHTMPPQQGQRYLAWVERHTFLNGQGMEQRHRDGAQGDPMDMNHSAGMDHGSHH
jgi:hypothetical protein